MIYYIFKIISIMMDPENKLRFNDAKNAIKKKVAKVLKIARKEKNNPVMFLCQQTIDVLNAAKTKSFLFVVKEMKSPTDIYKESDNDSDIGAEIYLLEESIKWHISALNKHFNPWQVQAIKSCEDLLYFYKNKILRTSVLTAYYGALNEKVYHQLLLKNNIKKNKTK